jgi:hypothetical protein
MSQIFVKATKGKKTIKPSIKGKNELIRRRAKPTHMGDVSLASNPQSTSAISRETDTIPSQNPMSEVIDLERPSSI